jgi:hypothetical protein
VNLDPTAPEPPAVLMQGALGQLRELERVLHRAGIAAEVVRPPASDANS